MMSDVVLHDYGALARSDTAGALQEGNGRDRISSRRYQNRDFDNDF